MTRAQGNLQSTQATRRQGIGERQDLLFAANGDDRQNPRRDADLFDQGILLVHGHAGVLGPQGHQ